jgi:hypothetical protein
MQLGLRHEVAVLPRSAREFRQVVYGLHQPASEFELSFFSL